jgi:hypothetical protein
MEFSLRLFGLYQSQLKNTAHKSALLDMNVIVFFNHTMHGAICPQSALRELQARRNTSSAATKAHPKKNVSVRKW